MEQFETAPILAGAPAVEGAPSRISRIDDVTPPPPVAVPAASPPPAVETPGQAPGSPPEPEPKRAPAIPAAGSPKSAAPARPSSTAAVQKQLAIAPSVPIPAEPELSPIELRDRRVAGYMRQAQRQQAAGDFAGLAKTCQRWADDDWRNPRAYYCAGLGLQGVGQHKQAIAMFNKAGALLPRDDPFKTSIADAVLRSFRARSGG